MVFLTVLRIGDGDGGRLDWLALGLGAGVGWWSSPEIAYFLVAGRRLPRGTPRAEAGENAGGFACLGVAAIGLGSLPWWWHNIRHHFDSLAGVAQPRLPSPGGAYWWHLGIFERYVFPLVLGLRRGRRRMGGAGQTDSASRERRDPGAHCLARVPGAHGTGLVAGGLCRRRSRFFTRLSRYTWYWHDARYAIFLAPVLGLVIVSLVCEAGTALGPKRGRRRRVMAALVLVAVLGLTLTSRPAVSRALQSDVPPCRPSGVRVGLPGTPTRTTCPRPSRTRLCGGTSATPFRATGSLTTSGSSPRPCHREPGGTHFIRYPAYYRAIAASTASAWIFVNPSAR